jgi:hypothetical protein
MGHKTMAMTLRYSHLSRGCENTAQMAWSQGCVDTCARVFISEASDAEFAKGDSKYDACAKKCFPGPEDPFDGLLH